MGKLTKIQKAIVIAQLLQILDGKRLYTEEEVAEMQNRINELEAEVALLKEGQSQMPEHANIRGREYYK